jgi:hypothetical protein
VQYQDLAQEAGGESSEVIKRRVNAARLVQQERFRRSKIHCNAQMPPRLLRRSCELDQDSRRLLETAIDKLGLSARAYNRILKIARTIADLAGVEPSPPPPLPRPYNIEAWTGASPSVWSEAWSNIVGSPLDGGTVASQDTGRVARSVPG